MILNLSNHLNFTLILRIALIGVVIKCAGYTSISNHTNKIDLLAVIFLLSIYYLKKGLLLPRSVNRPLSVYFLFLFVSILSSIHSLSIYTFAQLLLNLKLILILILCLQFNISQRSLFEVEKTLLLFMLLNMLILACQVLSPSFYKELLKGAITESVIVGTDIRRYSGLFYHPGAAGVFAGAMLVWGSIRLYYDPKGFSYLLWVVASVIALFFSGQRLESVAAISALFMVFIATRSLELRRPIFAVSTITTCIIVWYSIENVFSAELGWAGITQIDNARQVLYIGAVQLAENHFPFGYGLGTYGSSISEINPNSAYINLGISDFWWYEGESYLTDTYWAMIIGESGWIAAFLVLGFIVLLLLSIPIGKLRQLPADDHFFVLLPFGLVIYSAIISAATPVYTGTALPIMLLSYSYALCVKVPLQNQFPSE